MGMKRSSQLLRSNRLMPLFSLRKFCRMEIVRNFIESSTVNEWIRSDASLAAY